MQFRSLAPTQPPPPPVVYVPKETKRWRGCGLFTVMLFLLFEMVVCAYVCYEQQRRLDEVTHQVETMSAVLSPSPTSTSSQTPTMVPRTPTETYIATVLPTSTVDETRRCGAIVFSQAPLQRSATRNSEILGMLDGGLRLWVTGKTANGQWFRVQTGNTHGWMSAVYLDVLSSCRDDIPVVE